jgi:hypothetical protein
MTSVKDEPGSRAKVKIRGLLDRGWYVFRSGTPGRTLLREGDRLCFYEAGVGVIAEATVASKPELRYVPFNPDPERYPWAFKIKNVRYFFDNPVVLRDAELRSRLRAFKGKDANGPWAWFVQGTHLVSEHDFKILVRRA